MKEFSFKKKEHLRLKKDFHSVFQRGESFSNRQLIMYVKPRDVQLEEGKDLNSRIGIVVSKKIGNAIRRNRIKRLIREVFRLHKRKIIRPVDLIIIARVNIGDGELWQMEESILDLWRKAKIV